MMDYYATVLNGQIGYQGQVKIVTRAIEKKERKKLNFKIVKRVLYLNVWIRG